MEEYFKNLYCLEMYCATQGKVCYPDNHQRGIDRKRVRLGSVGCTAGSKISQLRVSPCLVSNTPFAGFEFITCDALIY